jgi:hypothetical protein
MNMSSRASQAERDLLAKIAGMQPADRVGGLRE